HQGGPVCEGQICGLAVADKPYQFEIVREGEILRCPWHRWEVDITTGRVLVHPTFRIKSYPVEVEKPSVETFPVAEKDGVVVLDAVEPEPLTTGVAACAERALAEGVDALIGVGGGSSMDTAKAASVLAVRGRKLDELYGADRVPGPGLVKILVPTTAGTGSEI